MEIIIKAVKVNGKQVIITDQAGKLVSGFATDYEGHPTGLAELHPGDEIEAEVVTANKDGRTYNNIKAFHVTAKNTKPQDFTKQEVSGPEHGLCLKMVGDLYLGGKLKDDDVLVKIMWSELNRVLGTSR